MAVKLIRFCEFTGDEHSPWDGDKKKLCQYAGFERCLLHNTKLLSYCGWRVCCDECKTPVQIKQTGE